MRDVLHQLIADSLAAPAPIYTRAARTTHLATGSCLAAG